MRNGVTGRYSPMSSRDAAFIYEEGPGHTATMIACYVFDASGGTPSTMSVKALEQWMLPRLGGADFLTRVLRRVPLEIGLPFWVPARELDLTAHLHVHRIDGGFADLRQKIVDIASAPIDLSRPPWEFHAVNGARNVAGADEVTAMILKIHHCATDGMGVRDLEKILFSDDPDAAAGASAGAAHPLETTARAVLGAPYKTFRFIRHARNTRADIEEVERLERESDLLIPRKKRPSTKLNKPMSGEPALAVTTFAFEDIRAARKAVRGATINDVLLTIVGGALHRQLAREGETPDGALAAKVPISLRIPDTQTRNNRSDHYTHLSSTKLVIGIVDLHSDIADPVERLAAVAESAVAEKARWMSDSFRRARSRMDEAPASLLALRGWVRGNRRDDGSRGQMTNTMVNNLPAPDGERRLDGAPLRTSFGVMSPVDGDRLRHLFTTGPDEVNLSISFDRDVLPDATAYLDDIHLELSSLLDASQRTTGRLPHE